MNEQKTNPLGTEKISNLLLRFAIPSIIAMVVSALYIMVDQFFIGRSVGMLGNAATNVAFPLVITCTAIALMCGIGGAANFNLCMGQQEKEEAASFAGNAITMLFSLGMILCIITRLFLKPMMILFGATSSVLDYSLIYTGITSLGFPFLILTTGGTNLVRADGSPKFSMTCTLTGAIINTILDPTLIFGFHMGIAGAAWATVIGQVVSGIMVILYLRKFKTVKLTKEKLRPHPHYIGRIVSLGMAPFFNQVSMMVVQIVMNNVLIRYGAKSSYGSDIPLACAGIITKINMIFFAINIGISQGLQPIISYNYGARKKKRITGAIKYAMIYSVSIMIVGTIIMQIFPAQLLKLFDASDNMLSIGVTALRIISTHFFFAGFDIIIIPSLQALGRGLSSMLVSFTRQLVVRLPVAYLLSLTGKLDAIWWAFPIAEIFSIMASLFFLRRAYNAEIKPMAD